MKDIGQKLLLAGASALLVATAAQAQTAAKDETPEEIVVTGSRVITNGNDSPTPVTVITTEDLTSVHPTNLVEALNDMPVFGGSRGQGTNTGTNGATGSPATSANSGNVINLRSLGLLRTLILYDGHRAPPSTPDGFVDADSIPQMLLKRVDVVTGGASAVYGSDAISGVVNFITDTKFVGVKADLQTGVSTYGDDRTAGGGLAFGTNLFSGRGHFMASYQNRHDPGIDSALSRPWGRLVPTIQGDGTAAFPYFQAVNARQTNATFGGIINTGALAGQQFTGPGGYLVPFVHGVKTGINPGQPYEIGGDGGYYNGQIRASLDMNQLYGRFDFDFTDNVHGYASVGETMNHSIGWGSEQSTTNTVMSASNAFLPSQYQAQLAAAGQTTFQFGKIYTGMPRGEFETFSRQLEINTGLQGSFGSGYKWDVAFTDNGSDFEVHNDYNINRGRMAAALDAVIDPATGHVVCQVSLTASAGNYPGCVPLDVFGADSESQQALNYILGRTGVESKIGFDDISASLVGAPFNTWAGPVNTALSLEGRRLTYEINSETNPNDRANCTNVRYNCNGTTPIWNNARASLAKVSTDVKEAAIEFGVPLLKDKSWAKSLDLNAAYRFAHYDLSGNANTWKVGFTWDPFDKLTVRATRSRDFRAPSLDELFRPLQVSFTAFPDYITGGAVATTNIRTENGGNIDLKPEVGNTLTYGVVFRPTNNLDFAVDAFDIKVTNAINVIQGNTPIYQQACYASGGASPYCQLIGRALGSYTDTSAANAVILWRQTFINLSEQDTTGADLEANFRTSIADKPLSLRVLTTYQPHLIYKQAGIVDLDQAGVSFGSGIQASPVWRVTGFASFRPIDTLTVSLQERWRSSLRHHSDPRVVVNADPVASVAYTALNLSFKPKLTGGTLEYFVNIQNLFNRDPPQAGFWGNPNPGQFGQLAFGDDNIGRYYTAGVHFRM